MDEEQNQDQNQNNIRLRFGKRTYFFDVKDASNGNKYLKITESRFIKEGERRRNVFTFFKDDVKDFTNKMKELSKAL